jgi:hypothetical protein
VIVSAGPSCTHLIGRIIRVRKAHHVPEFNRGPWAWSYYGKRLVTKGGRVVKLANDVALRPLRDAPGQDETLRIVGLPAPRTLALLEAR